MAKRDYGSGMLLDIGNSAEEELRKKGRDRLKCFQKSADDLRSIALEMPDKGKWVAGDLYRNLKIEMVKYPPDIHRDFLALAEQLKAVFQLKEEDLKQKAKPHN